MKLAWSILLLPLGFISAEAAIALEPPLESEAMAIAASPATSAATPSIIAPPSPQDIPTAIAFEPEPLAVAVPAEPMPSEPVPTAQAEPDATAPPVDEDIDATPAEPAAEPALSTIPLKSPDPWGETGFGSFELTPDDRARHDLLRQGDRAFVADDLPTAVEFYQEAKEPFALEQSGEHAAHVAAITDPDLLSPAAGVYWRTHQEGVEANLTSKIFAPLDLLLEEQPEFIPAYVSYAQELRDRNQNERALEILEQAANRYPDQPELLMTTIDAKREAEEWLDASLLARQFTILNPDHPQAEAFSLIADETFERYERKLRSRIRGNAIANILTGIVGFAVTGNIFGPISAVETAVILLDGEEKIGDRIANRVKEVAPMVDDPLLLGYVDEIGQALAQTTGRDEFTYEFNIILDDTLNAFALPGGKIFIHAGAILETETEAELAGLIAHEISHSALSHGFQLVTKGQFTANLAQYVPFGGLATNLLVFGYSRGMERQADRLGTRMLAASGYAADGVRNLMATLDAMNKPSPPAWLSTHPDTSDRVQYLETYILENGLNRYSFEGIDRHTRMRQRALDLINDYRQSADYRRRRDRRR
ncbi:M48 family metalloprotease [Spirulina major CS-329]|uniref:M48 family metalloprotease n=1 Tax=Spirulina TaxID=1154 RepID=UPI00232AC80E|nr:MULTISPECIES: M48 family metalloprotease [Spirulina]MDB9495175.1 M48 family metalloprotease [Spirulina subsalsa CS-330]MDB9502957.1 M48 family metalloprotease [Spirulina major CS-329]